MIRSQASRLKDVERWKAAGWLTPAGATEITNEIKAGRSAIGFASVLATLAAILIGFAAMSFVAANWQDMSKLARLVVIFGGMWTFLGLSLWLKLRDYPRIADASLLAAIAIYGSGIMLIAQMYHMDGRAEDAVLLWGIGAVATGLMTRSNPVLTASLAIFCVWSMMWKFSADHQSQAHWPFLITWAVVALGFYLNRWQPGLNILLVALTGWVIAQPYQSMDSQELSGHAAVTSVGLAMIATCIVGERLLPRLQKIANTTLPYGYVIAFAGAFALQFAVDYEQDYILIFGAIVLLVLIAGLAWAWHSDNRVALWIAYATFSIEVFALYLKKVGTLLGTSLFFLISGLIVAALAAAALYLHNRRQAGEGANNESKA